MNKNSELQTHEYDAKPAIINMLNTQMYLIPFINHVLLLTFDDPVQPY